MVDLNDQLINSSRLKLNEQIFVLYQFIHFYIYESVILNLSNKCAAGIKIVNVSGRALI